MNKLFTKIAGLALGFAMAIGVGVAVANQEAIPVHAAETSAYKMTTVQNTSNTAYATYYDNITIGTKTWKAPGNQNFSGYWRIGGKKIDNDTNISRYLQCKTAFSENITKVTLSHGGFSRSGISISGATLTIASDAAFSQNVQTSSITPSVAQSTASSFSFENASGWGTGKYYKIDLTMASTSTSNGGLDVKSIEFFYDASTPLTGITLSGTEVGGTSPNYTLANIAKSDTSTNHTVSVGLTPTTATDQKVKIEHYDGDSVVDVYSSPVTCTSGTGSFNVRAKGTAVGTERLKIYGNTETSVIRYLSVTVYDDTKTYWTVSFDSDGGASIADMSVEDVDTFEFPSPGTKDHHSFSGWSSDGGNTKYATGTTSPAVVNDITYTAYWQEDAKFKVTYEAGEHGSGDDYVVDDLYAGSYELDTFENAGFVADDGYKFTKWSVGGSEYDEGDSITISENTTVTAIYDEVVTYTIVTDASKLTSGTTFVLVGYINSTYYISNGLNGDHVLVTAKTSATTISNGTESGSTLVSSEAQILTIEGATDEFKIKYGDSYLKFTGNSNGNDSFDIEENASTFSVSMKGSYILFTCTSETGYGRVWRLNTSLKDMRNYATDSGVGDAYMFANIAPKNELDSVTVSFENDPADRTFTAGSTFAFNGTLTASYTIAPDDEVTPTGYFLEGEEGTGDEITTSTILTVADFNGGEVYVQYKEDGITKYDTFILIVNYAPVTSVVIDVHALKIGFSTLVEFANINVAVNSQYADQGYEWVAFSDTVNHQYSFDQSGVSSWNTPGTITIRCRSTADNTKYDELVITIAGNPEAQFTPSSTSGYAGKSVDVDFTYLNINNPNDISVVSDNTDYITIGEVIAENGEGVVTINFVSAGSATVSIVYNQVTLDSITATAIADTVTEVNWTPSPIKVYSGTILPVSIEDTWMVNYEMASGDADYLSYPDFTVKLGDDTITLPHTWDAADDGKALCVEYGGVSSSSITVDVTQTIRSVIKETKSTSDDTLTWTKKCGGSGTSSDSKAWTITSDGTESDFDSTRGIHYGTNNANVTYIKATSSAYNTGKITKVVVNASTASGVTATVGVKIDGKSFGGNPKSISSTPTDYTFTGEVNASSIEVEVTKPSSAKKALYLKSIIVTITTPTGSYEIANQVGHEAAQKAVVKFAKAFNTAMSGENVCSGTFENLTTAWANATSAWTAFTTEIAQLGDEEDYAKDLINWASAQWTQNTDSNYEYCLERAMATYERCVKLHGMTPFMSEVRTVTPSRSISIFSIDNSNMASIIVIISMISIAAVGGYFFLRKRKED